jgi:pimeloyl-ACP methyl ester carboxylesterase
MPIIHKRKDTSHPKRLRRILRKIATVILLFVIVLTLFSLIFNAFTQPTAFRRANFGKYLAINGAEVHYMEWGTGGSPIILIHGFLESTISWQSVAPLLAAQHKVYALDLAGYGYSQFNGRYSLDNEAQMVDGFINKLDLHNPILVGHSLGAAVVGDVALKYPRDTGGVIFADGDGLKLQPGPGWIRDAILATPFYTSIYRLLSHWTNLDTALIRRVCGPSCPAITPDITKQWIDPLHQKREEQALKSIASAGVIGLSTAQVATVHGPRAIIWGQYDKSNGGSLSGVIYNLHNPQVITIQGAGHLSMVAQPSQFAQAVESEMGHFH